MMEHLSTLFYRLLMHSSICILEEFNFLLFIYFIVNSYGKNFGNQFTYDVRFSRLVRHNCHILELQTLSLKRASIVLVVCE